jgi:hypothetical protein
MTLARAVLLVGASRIARPDLDDAKPGLVARMVSRVLRTTPALHGYLVDPRDHRGMFVASWRAEAVTRRPERGMMGELEIALSYGVTRLVTGDRHDHVISRQRLATNAAARLGRCRAMGRNEGAGARRGSCGRGSHDPSGARGRARGDDHR